MDSDCIHNFKPPFPLFFLFNVTSPSELQSICGVVCSSPHSECIIAAVHQQKQIFEIFSENRINLIAVFRIRIRILILIRKIRVFWGLLDPFWGLLDPQPDP
jgi:hypothetical protein